MIVRDATRRHDLAMRYYCAIEDKDVIGILRMLGDAHLRAH